MANIFVALTHVVSKVQMPKFKTEDTIQLTGRLSLGLRRS